MNLLSCIHFEVVFFVQKQQQHNNKCRKTSNDSTLANTEFAMSTTETASISTGIQYSIC